MNKYVTIQKLSDAVGIEASTIRNMLKQGILKKHCINGFKRIFIDTDEFNSLIAKNNSAETNIDMDIFAI